MGNTIKEALINQMAFLKKIKDLNIKIEVNHLENEILKFLRDNLHTVDLTNHIYSMSNVPIMTYKLKEKVCLDSDEEAIWSNIIISFLEQLSPKLENEGIRIDLVRKDGIEDIDIFFYLYSNPLIKKEMEDSKNIIKDLLKKEGPINESQAMLKARQYIKSLYQLPYNDWDSVPNSKKIDELLHYLFHEVLYKKHKKPATNSTDPHINAGQELVILINSHKFKVVELEQPKTIYELIHEGLIRKSTICLK